MTNSKKRSPARVGARNRAGNNFNGYPYTIDFHSINQAAVPALPAILGRLLSGGKIMGGEYVALNLRGQTIGRARSRLMFAPAIGPTSLAATRAAIP